jgi:predicted GNAT family N-acyltransferase
MITAPELLNESHDVSPFHCSRIILNEWLSKRAKKANHLGGSARTYVICSDNKKVIGYYSLATGSINHTDVSGKVKRNMPDPIPVIILGRLAIDYDYSGRGLGQGLLRDALLRVTVAAKLIGVRAVLVHALDDDAKRFYQRHGFYESPTNEKTLMLTVAEIVREIGSK